MIVSAVSRRRRGTLRWAVTAADAEDRLRELVERGRLRHERVRAGLSREAAEEAGADAFVSKTTAFDELAETILRVCGRNGPA